MNGKKEFCVFQKEYMVLILQYKSRIPCLKHKQQNKETKNMFFGFLLCVRNKQCLKCFTSAHSLILTFSALEYNVSTRSHLILLDRMATGRHSINGYRISMAQSQYFTWRLVPTLLSSIVFKTIALPFFSDSHEPHSLMFIPIFFLIYRTDLILIF